jgi:hypothetical protein
MLRLPLKEVVVHLLKTLNIVSSSTRLDLETIHSKLSWFSAYSLLVGVAGGIQTKRPDGRWTAGWLEKSKLRLTQPSLAATGAELGN